ncbi:MAG: hypothetical protein Q9174_000456 [Haloplaca sp. 1 TL-2023]
MPSVAGGVPAGLETFLSSVKASPIDNSVEQLTSDEAEEDREGHTNAQSHLGTTNSDKDSRLPSSLFTSAVSDGHTEANVPTSQQTSVLGASIPTTASLFGPILHPTSRGVSPLGTQRNASSRDGRVGTTVTNTQDFISEVIEGIQELIDELKQAEDQIAAYALDHVHTNEVILVHSLSATVQRFLLKVAAKRTFTVMCADTSSDQDRNNGALHNRQSTRPDGQGGPLRLQRNLAAAGINVILIPYSAVYAVMSRVNKVVLDSHVMLSEGSFVAAAGAKAVVQAANMHRAPVLVLGGIYQISPVKVFDPEILIEYGDPAGIIPFGHGDMLGKISVKGPLYDHISAKAVDLYITNLGGHAPHYLYRLAADHYRDEDLQLEDSGG